MSHAHEDMLRTLYEAFAKGDVETVLSLLTGNWSGRHRVVY
jgi:hypothetical protein